MLDSSGPENDRLEASAVFLDLLLLLFVVG